MLFAVSAVERAMKIQKVVVRPLRGAITWLRAADILGLDSRSVRRCRVRYEGSGQLALYHRRTQRPSRRKAPAPEVQRYPAPLSRALRRLECPALLSLRLPQPRCDLSYTFVKLALQEGACRPRAAGPARHAAAVGPATPHERVQPVAAHVPAASHSTAAPAHRRPVRPRPAPARRRRRGAGRQPAAQQLDGRLAVDLRDRPPALTIAPPAVLVPVSR